MASAPDRHDWVAADRVAAFARDHGMHLRGHDLVWHGSIPDWAVERLAKGAGWRLVGDHISSLVGRYGMQVDEWDVVNEPIEID